jgi:hypothetical protein
MARLNIPKAVLGVLRELAELQEDSFLEFLNGLKQIEPEIRQIEISALLARNVPSISLSNLREFLGPILSGYQLMASKSKTPQDLAADFVETIERDSEGDFFHKDALRERLEQLFSVGGSVAVVAKAITVMLEQDRNFCGARILSDIRPVFSDSPNDVTAAVVMHSLNLSFHQEGEHKEIYLALTDKDLKALRQVLERAERKSVALKALINKSGTRFLGTGD